MFNSLRFSQVHNSWPSRFAAFVGKFVFKMGIGLMIAYTGMHLAANIVKGDPKIAEPIRNLAEKVNPIDIALNIAGVVGDVLNGVFVEETYTSKELDSKTKQAGYSIAARLQDGVPEVHNFIEHDIGSAVKSVNQNIKDEIVKQGPTH